MSTVSWPSSRVVPELYVLGGLLVGALVLKLRYVAEVVQHAMRPGALTYTEGVNAILATRPELWYHPLGQAPHFPTIYPPLYHLVVGGLSLVGLNVFQAMHLVGLASGLAGGAALYAIARNLGGSHAAGWIAFGGYWLSPIVTGATVLGRVDHLGIALGLWAISAATRDGRGDPWTAGVLTVASMYVKHSLIVFPIAIVAWYWWHGHRRDAAAYFGFVGATGLLILAGLVAATDGRAWIHLVEINRQQQWFPLNALNLSGWIVLINTFLFAGVGVLTAVRRRLEPELVFLGLTILVSTALAGKAGAWSGYFLPTAAAASLSFALAADRYLRPNRSMFRWLLICVLLVGQAGQFAAMQPSPDFNEEPQQRVVKLIEATDGPVLTADNGVLVPGERQEPYEAQVLKTTTNGIVPDQARIVDRLRNGEFALVIIRTDPTGPSAETRWTTAQLDAIASNYELVGIYGQYRVYKPAT